MVSLLLAIIYLSFISLGLPDSLLGAGWPAMRPELNVPVSYAGIISMLIALCTIISSLNSDRLTKKFGAGLVTAVSVGMTALAMLGFSFSRSFWILCVLALPYGLGAGSVDAALNNYVALHFSSKHMSWLHCMWGVGTIISPYIMGYALNGGLGWQSGYRIVSVMQIVLTVILFITLPLWKINKTQDTADGISEPKKALTLKEISAIKGAKSVMITFFCYCAAEQTTMLWASSYLVNSGFSADAAAKFASMFFIGITLGRAASGFLTIKFTDTQMIRAGLVIMAAGIVSMILPLGNTASLVSLVLIGLGCAPIYPCIIHSTPTHFGADKSQAVIGVQMASAYAGTLAMPPIFGIIANKISVSLLPFYLLTILIIMAVMHETLVKTTSSHKFAPNVK